MVRMIKKFIILELVVIYRVLKFIKVCIFIINMLCVVL